MKCEYCGNEFTPRRKDNVYCSKRCKDNTSKVRRGISPVAEKIKICATCGKEFTTVYDRRLYCCDRCQKKHNDHKYVGRGKTGLTIKEYFEKRKRDAEERNVAREREKIRYRETHTVQRECVWCGGIYYCIDRESRKTCSKECSKKYAHHKRDKRIPKEQIVDKDITIKKLFKRDGGVCYLCGGVCDFNDWAVSVTGAKYPGDRYPEIEHVIPVSRGGLHAWDNVRLACHKCNQNKSDDIVNVAPMNKEQAYSEKKAGNPPKKTIQMSLDGKIIKIWKSTAQIKKELGLNDKRIQDVCRGEGKTAFGFRWMYA